MELKFLKPRKALNKAYLKVKPNRSSIEVFKTNLTQLLDRTNDVESEEFHKNLISDFLKKTYYDPNHFINTKGRNDLVIHNDKKANSSVGVIIEAKKPTNRSEMLTKHKLNVKAFQELILYYLRERITHKNLEIKYLIATNINEWFIFDANIFEKHFAQSKSLVKQFTDFEDERLAGKTTEFFYKEIAEPFIDSLKSDIEFTFFDIRNYEKPLRNNNPKDDNKLIALFKLLSPEHLLKLPFINDSNSLDQRFYGELLHIIGLSEIKKGSNKLIQRKKEGDRNTGSLIENSIIQIDSLDKLSRLNNPSHFGNSKEERLFNVSLELTITWINRILFLKLLEAQLSSYHNGDDSYLFLNISKVHNYDDLNTLFFQVLAKEQSDRNQDVKQLFEKIPYLNSSLFEPTGIEHATLLISNLSDDKTIPVYSSTVLKNKNGKKQIGELNTLEYLFKFLDAYDFSSEGSEEIQEENKTLINASVLGLIFEKINGYKDGSFFTPGFITMYMCKETIRKAILQRFNNVKNWNCKNLDELYNKIDDRKEANEITNNLKLCDPAVGSGHFLVSALNEIIAIKNDLRILQDRNGNRLKEYQFEVINDELIITDEDGEFFEYNPLNKESQRVQEALFHEKQNIIENCLFGVDINQNSVKICRLRLWIELLKHAYYKTPNELETLPNIDINIKCGNSLISRFKLGADLQATLRKSEISIAEYKSAVKTYMNAKSKEQKREMKSLIKKIKGDFKSTFYTNIKENKDLARYRGQLINLQTANIDLFGTKMDKKKINIETKRLKKLIASQEKKVNEIISNKVFEEAFEWRFEFPEVLNDDGEYIGFDAIIGNPPYFSISKAPELKQVSKNFKSFTSSGDIYSLFIELSHKILKNNGISTLIISNKWMRANYGKNMREYLVKQTNPFKLIDFGQNLIFESAIVHTNIISFSKNEFKSNLAAVRFPNNFFNQNVSSEEFSDFINENKIQPVRVSKDIWNIIPNYLYELKLKAENKGRKLSKWNIEFYRGFLTGLNDAFILSNDIAKKLLEDDPNNIQLIKPLLRGRDIRRYFYNNPTLSAITTFPARNINIESYPIIEEYLKSFQPKIKQTGEKFINEEGEIEKTRKKTSHKWYETQDTITYYKEFLKPKIIFSEIVSEPQFYYDEEGFYPEATAFFISGNNLKYLTALLNSKAITFLFNTFYMGGELVGKIRYKKAFLEQVPIPVPDQKTEDEIGEIVDQILNLKKENSNFDSFYLEEKINKMVYDLFDFNESEIEVIENYSS
ncbi:Eco57I restriction-modification methylase domain-containing protein [Gramella sp. MAR_2010_147]|uniref:DUF7149 domain-containing protein n=1 Tax=Gramella sp. MAR_2010_147 TaxID=1250205 RepID=UPI000879652E|nr:Eco57I restriction-modification methylase domain-containing protein [Gramella sp. MAR_2010_147]SDS06143.1 Type II restriction/modification system, DNA methylase subunit YeeA [Gramella sp. MAR_2010_147]